MMQRFLIGLLFLSLAATAQPDDRAKDESIDRWTFGYGSEEGSSGSAYMGVDIADVTAERLSALKLKEEHGAEITMVDEDAPAGKAGLHEHDVILSLNGTTIESAAQLRRIIKETPPGRVVTLGISRDGQPLTIKVPLADRNKEKSWHPGSQAFNFKMPDVPPIPDIDLPVTVVIAHHSLRSGLMVENISPQLGEYFGVKDGNGVLIRSVEKGSRGQKAGFRAGDVIVKVNSQPVHDASDFTHALRGSAGDSASVTIMRDRHEQSLTLSLPDKKDSGQLLEGNFDPADLPEVADQALAYADNEVARLDLEKIREDAAEQAHEAMQCVQSQLQKEQKEIRKSMEDQQKQMRDQERKIREQTRKFQEQQRKLERELARKWAEI